MVDIIFVHQVSSSVLSSSPFLFLANIFSTHSLLFLPFLPFRSGSLCAVILSHMFCNSMGFPIFDSSHPQKKLIGASWVLGLVGFFGGCWFCMSPELFDNDVYY